MVEHPGADEIEELLGAYALDAVDDDERRQVDEYLRRNPSARDEVARMQHVAADLAYGDVEAPVELWPRIELALEHVPPPLELPDHELAVLPSRQGARPQRSRRAVVAGLAAAAVLVTGVLGFEVVRQQRLIDDVAGRLQGHGVRALAESARREPEARTVTLRSHGGQFHADVVYLRRGQGYLVGADMDPLPADRTYQLWALVGDRNEPITISAAVLGPAPRTAAFTVRGRVVGFMITEEAAPGAAGATTAPLLQGGVV